MLTALVSARDSASQAIASVEQLVSSWGLWPNLLDLRGGYLIVWSERTPVCRDHSSGSRSGVLRPRSCSVSLTLPLAADSILQMKKSLTGVLTSCQGNGEVANVPGSDRASGREREAGPAGNRPTRRKTAEADTVRT